MTPAESAREIIRKIFYITIATYSYRERKPWISPVYSAFDEQYNFYWISGKSAQHSQNIRDNNEIAIVIYDSTAAEGTGEGVYMEAVAFEVEDEREIAHAIPLLYDRMNQPHRDIFDFVDSSPQRVYKASPKKVWMNSSEKMGSQFVHTRREINLAYNERTK